jgi:hypothetical protein
MSFSLCSFLHPAFTSTTLDRNFLDRNSFSNSWHHFTIYVLHSSENVLPNISINTSTLRPLLATHHDATVSACLSSIARNSCAALCINFRNLFPTGNSQLRMNTNHRLHRLCKPFARLDPLVPWTANRLRAAHCDYFQATHSDLRYGGTKFAYFAQVALFMGCSMLS